MKTLKDIEQEQFDDKKTVNIPLNVWFNNNKNERFEKAKFEIILKVLHIMGSINFESTDPAYYSNIKDSIINCRYELQRACGMMFPLPQYFEKELNYIRNKIIGKVIPEKFYKKLILNKTDEINGYKLFDCEENIMDWFSFIDFTKLYRNSIIYSREEFFEKCTDKCCTDWAKMDRHGECYGGFWLIDEENAWELSRQDNFEGLYALPFPHELIFKTIDIGCSNRMESVRYSNFLCWWIECKMKQIGMI